MIYLRLSNIEGSHINFTNKSNTHIKQISDFLLLCCFAVVSVFTFTITLMGEFWVGNLFVIKGNNSSALSGNLYILLGNLWWIWLTDHFSYLFPKGKNGKSFLQELLKITDLQLFSIIPPLKIILWHIFFRMPMFKWTSSNIVSCHFPEMDFFYLQPQKTPNCKPETL